MNPGHQDAAGASPSESGRPHWHPPQLPGPLRAAPQWAARLALEARMPAEVASWVASPEARGASLPRAPRDARPVLLVPGFGFGDPAFAQMHVILRRLGYRTYRSKITLNVRCSDVTVDHLEQVAERALAPLRAQGRAERLAVVGQSRGGMLARGLGARRPDLVDTVVNLGGCLNDEFAFYEIPQPFVVATRTAHHAVHTELRERGCGTPECGCPYMRAAHATMPEQVRVVSVYTREDGIVDWRACVLPGAENIEVSGSHLGMGFNAEVLRVLALALAES